MTAMAAPLSPPFASRYSAYDKVQLLWGEQHSKEINQPLSPEPQSILCENDARAGDNYGTSSDGQRHVAAPEIRDEHSLQQEVDGSVECETSQTQDAIQSQSSLSLDASMTVSFTCEGKTTYSGPARQETPPQTRPGLLSKLSTYVRRKKGSRSSVTISRTMDIGQARFNTTSTLALGQERRNTPVDSSSSGDSSLYMNQRNSLMEKNKLEAYQSPKSHINVNEPSKDDIDRSRRRVTTGIGFRRTVSQYFSLGRIDRFDFQHHRHDTRGSLERINTGIIAPSGTGLKARRMSLNILPDQWDVPVKELSSEFPTWKMVLGWSGKKIGTGATANVTLRHQKGTGELFAVKEFRAIESNERSTDYLQKIKSEFAIARSVRHVNIAETIMLCTHHNAWYVVMEFCEGGDLFSLVSLIYLSRNDRRTDRFCLFKQLVYGLDYLHSQGIAHRDIKPENLLLTKNSKLKITDFGSSEVFCGKHPAMRSAGGECGKDMGDFRLCDPGICGSIPYLPPEVVEQKKRYDPRLLDVWGAGIVMLCMIFNGNLWNEAELGSSHNYDDMVNGWAKWHGKHIGKQNPKTTIADYPVIRFFDEGVNPPALRRLLINMLHPDPSKRISIAKVARNWWIKGSECCEVYHKPPTNPAIPVDDKSSTIHHDNHLPAPKSIIRRSTK